MTNDVMDKYKELEFVTEKLVDYCNNVGIATACELIAVEAALERLYKARQKESEKDMPNVIIRMAREAGWEMPADWNVTDGFLMHLERFAELFEAKVQADERNACAALCSEVASGRDAEAIEEAILARGEK